MPQNPTMTDATNTKHLPSEEYLPDLNVNLSDLIIGMTCILSMAHHKGTEAMRISTEQKTIKKRRSSEHYNPPTKPRKHITFDSIDILVS
jgi:hypothetical protein